MGRPRHAPCVRVLPGQRGPGTGRGAGGLRRPSLRPGHPPPPRRLPRTRCSRGGGPRSPRSPPRRCAGHPCPLPPCRPCCGKRASGWRRRTPWPSRCSYVRGRRHPLGLRASRACRPSLTRRRRVADSKADRLRGELGGIDRKQWVGAHEIDMDAVAAAAERERLEWEKEQGQPPPPEVERLGRQVAALAQRAKKEDAVMARAVLERGAEFFDRLAVRAASARPPTPLLLSPRTRSPTGHAGDRARPDLHPGAGGPGHRGGKDEGCDPVPSAPTSRRHPHPRCSRHSLLSRRWCMRRRTPCWQAPATPSSAPASARRRSWPSRRRRRWRRR